MHPSPTPVLVDPSAIRRTERRQRLASIAVGVLIAAASALPFAATMAR